MTATTPWPRWIWLAAVLGLALHLAALGLPAPAAWGAGPWWGPALRHGLEALAGDRALVLLRLGQTALDGLAGWLAAGMALRLGLSPARASVAAAIAWAAPAGACALGMPDLLTAWPLFLLFLAVDQHTAQPTPRHRRVVALGAAAVVLCPPLALLLPGVAGAGRVTRLGALLAGLALAGLTCWLAGGWGAFAAGLMPPDTYGLSYWLGATSWKDHFDAAQVTTCQAGLAVAAVAVAAWCLPATAGALDGTLVVTLVLGLFAPSWLSAAFLLPVWLGAVRFPVGALTLAVLVALAELPPLGLAARGQLPGLLQGFCDLQLAWAFILAWLPLTLVPWLPQEGPWRRGRELACVLAIAALVVLPAWIMSHPTLVGRLRDDGEYMLYARALAAGMGYVHPGLPGHPLPSRFPPGFSAILWPFMLGTLDPWLQALRGHLVELAFDVLYVLAAHRFFRVVMGFGPGPAVGLTALVALNGTVTAFGYEVMADVPFATLSLGVILLAEHAMRSEAPFWQQPRSWSLVGLAIGMTMLVRAAGLALAGAVPLTLLLLRRPAQAGWVLLGTLAIEGPWTIYAKLHQAEDYLSYSRGFLPATVGEYLQNVATGLGYMTALSVPHFFAPLLFGGTTLGPLLGGLVLLAAIAAGLLHWYRQPPNGASRSLVPLFVLATLVISVAYGSIYIFYKHLLYQRLFLPILPMLVGALWLTLTRWLPRRHAAGVVAAMVAMDACSFAHHTRLLARLNARIHNTSEYAELFHQVVDRTPLDAHLIAPCNAMVTFYTGRLCWEFTSEAPKGDKYDWGTKPRAILGLLQQNQIDFVVASPNMDWDAKQDATVVSINLLGKLIPGFLTPVYVSKSGRFALFQVHPELLKPEVLQKLPAT